MTQTITALFDTRERAERARRELTSSGIGPARVDLSEAAAPADPDEIDRSFFAQVKDFFLPQSDTRAYARRLGRHTVVLAAEVDDAEADRAIRLLERCGPIEAGRP